MLAEFFFFYEQKMDGEKLKTARMRIQVSWAVTMALEFEYNRFLRNY